MELLPYMNKHFNQKEAMHETVLGAGALGRPRGIEWRGRWEVGLGWGIHVNPWLIMAKTTTIL